MADDGRKKLPGQEKMCPTEYGLRYGHRKREKKKREKEEKKMLQRGEKKCCRRGSAYVAYVDVHSNYTYIAQCALVPERWSSGLLVV